MDILQSIDTNVSSMVSSSFDEFISTKVKEAVEKEKEKFLNDLNMCEEEYPVFDESKNTKFEACKIVNDNSLPFQGISEISSRRSDKLDTTDEYILNNININETSLELTDNFRITSDGMGETKKSIYYKISNKGNIIRYASLSYQLNAFKYNSHLPIKHNYKILDYISVSGCRGPVVITEGTQHCLEYRLFNKDDITNQNEIGLDKVNGWGCKFRCNCPDQMKQLKNHYQPLRNTSHTDVADGVGWREDCIERFISNNICPDCRSGEVIQDKLDPDINIEIFRNPPIFNFEYIELLELLSKKGITIPIYQIQTIYSKYHPRANENFVIEEKIKKLTQIEKVVEEKVEEERKGLEKEKEVYSEKIKQVNEEKLKRIFSMFILRNERKENIKDKNMIRGMIKRSNDKCKKKEQEQVNLLEKLRQDLNSEKEDFEKEKEEFLNDFKSRAKSLLDIANDINEINELQEDTTEKSDELFNLMKTLNEMN